MSIYLLCMLTGPKRTWLWEPNQLLASTAPRRKFGCNQGPREGNRLLQGTIKLIKYSTSDSVWRKHTMTPSKALNVMEGYFVWHACTYGSVSVGLGGKLWLCLYLVTRQWVEGYGLPKIRHRKSTCSSLAEKNACPRALFSCIGQPQS